MISVNENTTNIQHGGNLETAINEYGFDKDQWLDLSTGISPWSWPVQTLDDDVWRNLPPSCEKLIAAASNYYDVDKNEIIATPGSQMAIRLLPQLFKPSTVAIPSLGYQEHRASWQLANHTVVLYHNTTELIDLLDTDQVEHVVVINPNNPSGEVTDQKTINNIAIRVPGVLIIDEAFIDFYEHLSSAKGNNFKVNSVTKNLSDNTIVLRSMGKFFGLAGIRIGFAIGTHQSITQLNTLLQPWSISNASIVIATQALADKSWQQQQCQRIQNQTKTFLPILTRFISKELNKSDQKSTDKQNYEIKSCGLFTTVIVNNESDGKILEKIQQKLAEQAVWIRLFNLNDKPAWLRFSLPADIQELSLRLKNV